MTILYIGNKNYSTWSLRGWLAVKLAGIPFEERLVPLSGSLNPEWKAFSPSQRVPALHHDGNVVWDSLAIGEYLAERYTGVWPTEPKARAWARCVVAEMHSGFPTLRSQMAMCIRERVDVRPWSPELAADIERVTEIWNEGRSRFGAGGDYLCGAFSLADAFFAPVAFRFRTYAVKPESAAGGYLESLLAHPFLAEWERAALAETAIIEAVEPRLLYRHPST